MTKTPISLAAAAAALAVATAAGAAEPPLPCKDDPMFAQQDFTVGAWEVFSGERKTAEVTMEKALNGCTISETWTPTRPNGHGLGLFTYSRLLKAWNYFWVSDTGQTTYFTGEPIGPTEMRYVTRAPLAAGGERLRHWTLSLQPDGRVRELSQGSEDGGRTWAVEYDLMWRKKN